MGKFNTTNKGYRFDKVIFFSVVGVMFIILGVLFSKYGVTYKPYLNCEDDFCENPFYNNGYKCSWGFGTQKCQMDTSGWLNEEKLVRGEYGQRPVKQWAFVLVISSLVLLAFCVNHYLWNQGKQFHLNVFDLIEKMEEMK